MTTLPAVPPAAPLPATAIVDAAKQLSLSTSPLAEPRFRPGPLFQPLPDASSYDAPEPFSDSYSHPITGSRPGGTCEHVEVSAPAPDTAAQVDSAAGRGTCASSPRTYIDDLPEEVQQLILSLIVGNLRSTSSSAETEGHGTKDWSRAMRHTRAKDATNLALVTRTWRTLIQERLYRHGNYTTRACIRPMRQSLT